ncbi:MAG TPA: hypothetical protein VG406_08965 [Isosphaeraceae bacterium]|jgi:DNA-directed RNA polymerase subunit RPC12/RpoP|nr:hypothetical protein [Isosphaeraceae bacterium]
MRPRFTIGQGMVLVALLALALAARTSPSAFVVLFTLQAFAAIVLGVNAAISASLGIRCPTCGKRTLRRRSAEAFGYRFYDCGECGARYKRLPLEFAWHDASGLVDADRFRPRAGAGADPWGGGPSAGADTGLAGTTGDLLRNQRRRRPGPPGPA